MRVALVSDLHGSEIALEAVLRDVARVGVDQLVCLGDVATLGPAPTAVLQRVRERASACIMGNHDAFLLDAELIHTYTEAPVIVSAVDWCRASLAKDELDFVRTFQPTIELPLHGGVTMLLYHGSPRSNTEDILATTPADDLDRMLAGTSARVLAGGHTHLQMLRQHRGRLIVNPGSLGMPFQEYTGGRTPTVLGHAEYAIVEAGGDGVTVTLRRVPIDVAAVRAAAAAWGQPLGAALAQGYI